MSILLVADIGGTKIDFALVDMDRPGFTPVHQGQLESARYHSCPEAIGACLDGFSGRVDFASLAVAGPILEQHVSFTNLPWQTGVSILQQEFGFTGVILENDLVALAEGVELLGEHDVLALKPGPRVGRDGRLVVAPGTGLGAAFSCRDGHSSSVQATEAGHLSFSPRTDIEMQLLSFLRKEFGHVSFEMVCSGTGLGNIFAFLLSTGLAVPDDLANKIEKDIPLAPLLAERALADDIDCPLSTGTYQLFFDILAEFCGNLALASLPGAGIYLGGGMLPRLVSLLDRQRFIDRFKDRGKMQNLVDSIPICLITHPQSTLLGAYRLGHRAFNDAA